MESISAKRREHFYRMSTGILDCGAKCKRKLLDKHLQTLNLTLKDFITNHQHVLYHLCFNRRPCQCYNNTICDLPRNRVLHPAQLEILFEKQSNVRLPGHKGANDFCCCTPKNVDTKDLDITLVHCILINCCLDLFWNCCLTGSTFENLLNANKHDIYHLIINNTNMCKLCSPNNQPKMSVSNQRIRRDQWDTLYNYINDPLSATAKIGIKTSDLENDLACALLNVLCPLKIMNEKLISLRNKMQGHATKGEIDKATFKEKWKELKECSLYIASECNMVERTKRKLREIKTRPIDQHHFDQLRFKLQADEKNFRSLKKILRKNLKVQEEMKSMLTSSREEVKDKILVIGFNINTVGHRLHEEDNNPISMKLSEVPNYTTRTCVDVLSKNFEFAKNEYEKLNGFRRNIFCLETPVSVQGEDTSGVQMNKTSSQPRITCAKMIDKKSFKVTWINATTVDHCIEYRNSSDKSSEGQKLVEAKHSATKVVGLDEDIIYEVRVASIYGNQIISYSSWVKIFSEEVSKKRPDSPIDLTYIETEHGIKFKWHMLENMLYNVTGYLIGCGMFEEGGYQMYRIGPDDKEYEFTSLFPNTTYILTIRSFNYYGYSETASIKIKTGKTIIPEYSDSDSDSDSEDDFRCGQCGYVGHILKTFQKHKRECRKAFAGQKDNLISHRRGAILLKTDSVITASTVSQINENKEKISSNGIELIITEKGSLILWTVISKELFQSKDLFQEQLKLFLENVLKHFDQETNTQLHVEVIVNVKENEDKGNTREDCLKCGRCHSEFTNPADFTYHKNRACKRRKKNTKYIPGEVEEEDIKSRLSNVNLEETLGKRSKLSCFDIGGSQLLSSEDEDVIKHERGSSYLLLPSDPPIIDEEDDNIRLHWKEAMVMNSSGKNETIYYTIEMSLEVEREIWIPIVSGLLNTCAVFKDDYPSHDCKFRVIAQKSDATSSPTVPVVLKRNAELFFPTEKAIATLEETGTIKIAWKAATYCDINVKSQAYRVTYDIEFSNDNLNWWTFESQLTNLSYKLDRHMFGQAYLRVTARNKLKKCRPTESIYISLGNDPYFPKDNLKMTWTETGLPTITWQAATYREISVISGKHQITYAIDISADAIHWRNLISGIRYLSFTLNEGVSSDVTYNVRVKACNMFVESPPTKSIEFAIRGVLPILDRDPPNLTEDHQYIILKWKAAEPRNTKQTLKDVSYIIEYKSVDTTNRWVKLDETKINQFIRKDTFDFKTDYEFRVKTALNNAGRSSKTLPVTLKRPRPDLPKNKPFLVFEEDDSIYMQWMPAHHSHIPPKYFLYFHDFTIKYSVEASIDNSRNWIEYVSDLLHPSCILNDLDMTQHYQFRIRANSALGSSDTTLPLDVPAEIDTSWIKRCFERGGHEHRSMLKRKRRANNSVSFKKEILTDLDSEPFKKVGKFDCSLCVDCNWNDNLRYEDSVQYQEYKESCIDQMTGVFKAYIPYSPFITIKIWEISEGSIKVRFSVYIEYPKEDPVTETNIKEALERGVNERKTDQRRDKKFSGFDINLVNLDTIEVNNDTHNCDYNPYCDAQILAFQCRRNVHSTSIEASVEGPFQLPISQKFQINDCIVVMDKIICADFRKCKIISFHFQSPKWEIIDEFVMFPENEFISALAKIGQLRIAVMFGSCITFIDLDKHAKFMSHLTRDLPTKKACAVSIWTDSLYIIEEGLGKLCLKECDLWANLRRQVDLPYSPDKTILTNVQLFVREQIYMNTSENSVVCFDKRGLNILWQFRADSLNKIFALTIDQYNYLYVIHGNKLTVISPDGNYYKVLVKGLPKMSSINFDDNEQYLVLSSKQGTLSMMNLKVIILKDSLAPSPEKYVKNRTGKYDVEMKDIQEKEIHYISM